MAAATVILPKSELGQISVAMTRTPKPRAMASAIFIAK